MRTVQVSDFSGWRKASRCLLAQEIPPEQIQWLEDSQASLFDETSPIGEEPGKHYKTTQFQVPSAFVKQVRQASCYLDQANHAEKWAVFYSLLWRIKTEGRSVLTIKSDAQVAKLNQMCRAVSRDCHKMKAFVRFQKTTQLVTKQNTEYFTCWFEPDHEIVERVAPFFARRFAGMTFSILTPHGCAHWNRQELKLSPGIARPDLCADEYEMFWRAYYCNIFNPARLKEQAMRSEMPKKYWQYLPESACIRSLAVTSSSVVENMLNAVPTDSQRLRLKSQRVRESQDTLRQSDS